MKGLFRSSAVQCLERRCLLAADPFGTNSLQPLDVTRDAQVSALDALVVINAIALTSDGKAIPADSIGRFVDVNGDGVGTASDALAVINRLATPTPLLAAKLSNDSSPPGSDTLGFDLRTNDYTLDIAASNADLGEREVLIRIGENSTTREIRDLFVDNRVRLSAAQIDDFFGGPLPDGEHPVVIEMEGSNTPPIEFMITVDRNRPELADVFPKRSVLAGDSTVEIELVDGHEELFLDPDAILIVDVNDEARMFRPAGIELASQRSGFQVLFDEAIPEGDYEMRIDQSRISTITGNPVGGDIQTFPLSVLTPTAVFSNPEGGQWDERGNWELGQVPGDGDVVLIDINPGAVVQIRDFRIDAKPRHVFVDGTLQVIDGSLTTDVIELSSTGRLELVGGDVRDAIITGRGGAGEVVVEGNMDVSNVTLEVPTIIEAGGTLDVEERLTLRSEIEMRGTDNDRSLLSTRGNSVIDGQGTIRFATIAESQFANNVTNFRDSSVSRQGQTMTIGPGITITGLTGQVDQDFDNGGGVDFQGTVKTGPDSQIELVNVVSSTAIRLDTPGGGVRFPNLRDANVVGTPNSQIIIDDTTRWERVTINVPVTVPADRSLFVRDELTLNSSITLEGSDEEVASVEFGSSSVSPDNVRVNGDGQFIFAGTTSEPAQNYLHAGSRDNIFFGPGIDITGRFGRLDGDATFGNFGALHFQGTIEVTDGGRIETDHLFGGDQPITIDSRAGTVTAKDMTAVTVRGVGDSRLSIVRNSAFVQNVTFDLPVDLFGVSVFAKGQTLTVNSELVLSMTNSLASTLDLDDDGLVVNGSGTIVVTGTDESEPSQVNDLVMSGENTEIGSGLTVRGRNGKIRSTDGEVRLVRATLAVDAGGEIELRNILTSPGVIDVPVTAGDLVVVDLPANTRITGAPGAVLHFGSVLSLENAVVEIPIVVRASSLHVRDGLTLNSSVSFRGSSGATLLLFGSQIISGTGAFLFQTTSLSYTVRANAASDELVTIQSGITIGASSEYRGSIRSDSSSQTIQFNLFANILNEDEVTIDDRINRP